MIGWQFKMRLFKMVVRPYFKGFKGERLIELYHKVVPEIFGTPPLLRVV